MNDGNDVTDEAVQLNRARLVIDIGAYVRRGTTVYKISEILDFESLIGMEVETGRSTVLRISELMPLDEERYLPALSYDCAEIADKDWQVAQERFVVIRPLLHKGRMQHHLVLEQAEKAGVHPATLYRWLERYDAYGTVAALIPQKRGWASGKSRLPAEVEVVVEQVIQEFYLTKQRPSAKKAIIEVQRLCSLMDIKPPSHMTIRKRIANVSEREQLRGRGYREKARNRFVPAAGTFPNANYPLAVVQIDHTPADIILVDDEHRKPIGRPWITLAIDVCTRVVTGYYLSFDPPSETSVGMCVAHSMLPKEDWMILHKVDAEWPVWGTPQTIHVDNGADFRSDNFRKSCLPYGINLEFRPVRQPQYGGHIERALGTLLKEIHDLPGTTFSSIKDREGYDSEKHAVMTKSEFEHWLVTFICKVYHQRMHTGIGMAPIKKWEIGVFGNADEPGVGMPPRPADRHTILLDFLPSFQRTVQTFGVTIDGIRYYAEALRPWINSRDNETGKKLELVFRRDPRDISKIWFFDPELGHYYEIPFANQSLPSMSIWEFQKVKEKLKSEGAKSIDEHEILRAVTELRAIVEESQQRTKKARRQAQRRKEHEKKITPAAPLPAASPAPTEPGWPELDELDDGDLEPFGEIS